MVGDQQRPIACGRPPRRESASLGVEMIRAATFLALLLTSHMRCVIVHVESLQEPKVVASETRHPSGTLDLMVLRTLSTLGSLHGYGIAGRIEQVSGDRIILNQGTIYTSLVAASGFGRNGESRKTNDGQGFTA